MSQIIVYRSMLPLYGIVLVGMSASLILGYYLPLLLINAIQTDSSYFLLVFFGVPLILAIVPYYIGWYYKRQVIEYHAPQWQFEPFQMTVEDAKRFPREYNRKHVRLVASSSYWSFFVPILLLIVIIGFPMYSFSEELGLIWLIPIVNSGALALLFLIALIGSFKAASNVASSDFTLPLIREAIKLAETQKGVAGICHVRVVLDRADAGEFSVYSNPRVVIRIEGLEKDAYIESWSEELRAITRVLCRLYEQDDHPQVVWWWFSTDRYFRKFVHPDENGYYVKLPVRKPKHNPGVKDVALVTRNAVALLVQEYLKTRGQPDKLRQLFETLSAENN